MQQTTLILNLLQLFYYTHIQAKHGNVFNICLCSFNGLNGVNMYW